MTGDLDDRHLSFLELLPPFTGDVSDPRPEACGMSSPGGAMLCDLPTSVGPHYFRQHLGIDRHGNLRGWRDGRDRG